MYASTMYTGPSLYNVIPYGRFPKRHILVEKRKKPEPVFVEPISLDEKIAQMKFAKKMRKKRKKRKGNYHEHLLNKIRDLTETTTTTDRPHAPEDIEYVYLNHRSPVSLPSPVSFLRRRPWRSRFSVTDRAAGDTGILPKT